MILFQEEKVTLSSTVEKFQSELHKIGSEKGELLADNQRMAELLAVSEGESQVMEGLIEERRSLQRQCKQLRDNGESPYYSRHICQSELQGSPTMPSKHCSLLFPYCSLTLTLPLPYCSKTLNLISRAAAVRQPILDTSSFIMITILMFQRQR